MLVHTISGLMCVCVVDHTLTPSPHSPSTGPPPSYEDVSVAIPTRPHPQISGSRDIHHSTIPLRGQSERDVFNPVLASGEI